MDQRGPTCPKTDGAQGCVLIYQWLMEGNPYLLVKHIYTYKNKFEITLNFKDCLDRKRKPSCDALTRAMKTFLMTELYFDNRLKQFLPHTNLGICR